MSVSPDFASFERAYAEGRPQLVQRSLVNDLETPVSAYLKLAGARENAFLLESVEGGEQLGRFSIIGFKPDVIWRCHHGKAEINRDAAANAETFTAETGAPLDSLKKLLAESELDVPQGAPPMAAGVFGYLGYDMVRQMERLGERPKGGVGVADSIFIRPTVVAVFDNVRQEISLFSPVRPEMGVSARAAYSRASERLADAVSDLQAPVTAPVRSVTSEDITEASAVSNTPRPKFEQMVQRAKDYIGAGDIFQVVLSQRFSRPFQAPPFELYRALRRSNPSPFMFYFNFKGFSVVGSSPEILVRVRDGEVTIRPIAGTRPRGATPEQDKQFEIDLINDPKERAEHLMLLDLGRNDVGRSAAIGSVKVTDQFSIERYSHVMHIVSNVIGKLRDGEHPVNAVVSGFPAGTVSGAPKIRAMQIIDELETSARGVYAGAIGYFSANGNVDTCIALRTAVVKDGVMHVQAGAGIVADSDPASEQAECENKAKALFAAAESALAGQGNR
ncbi:anthranilate synthase component I [Hyphococcus sp.]|uniref:anthranilate synthase component I n=1 Tax=Hyphococcus sp. TaxID=2038636 RepID=UPI00207E90A5|nr:MAG: anthranilate synthase component I [Marinicaulis sp.]